MKCGLASTTYKSLPQIKLIPLYLLPLLNHPFLFQLKELVGKDQGQLILEVVQRIVVLMVEALMVVLEQLKINRQDP